MESEDKLKELGYEKGLTNDECWRKFYNEHLVQVIVLDEFSKIEYAFIDVVHTFIYTQQNIDDIQIAFNRLKKDIQNLKQ